MTERPIIFSSSMIRALLAGRKTQTRRVLKPKRGVTAAEFVTAPLERQPEIGTLYECPRDLLAVRFTIGDRLWVRETFAKHASGIDYRADLHEAQWKASGPWKSPIHMPRWASRLMLTVTNVRVERLQDLSEADAIAEGMTDYVPFLESVGGKPANSETNAEVQARLRWPQREYAALWNSLHGPNAWDNNPWVAALTFTIERIGERKKAVAA